MLPTSTMTMRALTLLLCIGSLSVVACGTTHVSGEDAGTSDAATPIDAQTPVDAVTPVDAYRPPGMVTRTVSIGPLSTRPGEEHTRCVVLDAGNDAPMMLVGVRVALTQGSHHVIVSRASDSPLDPVPSECGAFSHGVSQTIFIAQQMDSGLTYPPGAGLRFEAHQHVGLEMHYINYFSDSPVDIQGNVELDLVPIEEGFEEVQILFTGETALYLPAHTETMVESHHSLPFGARVIGVTSHTHELGVLSTIHRVTGEGDPGGTLLHESRSWAEPPLDTFDPLLEMGGDDFRLRCTFNNTRDEAVTFGTGFQDEMCFLWAYYLEAR